ncbi:hypothetical protein FNJ88_04140 [Chryseobacterium sp. SNU WT5]|uniref:type VI secretion system TssO n=1 Tax=Chryseobacterium sp. SNU WT5 TaxID=2594269 RepID=UPI00117CC053|nr:type VI secretion system TssO [Chryseobacterium sp. SNU WT5]QDP84778.1 hypothetical protein FNJ88_04140 [Chryseobacterium sp. SNU WT5]
MVTSGQEKLNKKAVNKGIWGFVISFVLLTGITFLAVFMFFKSSEFQQKEVDKEVSNYRMLQSKNNLLQDRMETIYSNMSRLASDQVQNEIFLRDKIIEDIRDCKNIMGEDSIKEFKQYATLIKNMSEMIILKNDLISVAADEQVASRNLLECQDRLITANENLINSTPTPRRRPVAGRRNR